jgi:hypothetical protein
MHGVATKELEYVQGSSSMDDARDYMPTPGYTPDDSFISDQAMSPEAQSLIQKSSG